MRSGFLLGILLLAAVVAQALWEARQKRIARDGVAREKGLSEEETRAFQACYDASDRLTLRRTEAPQTDENAFAMAICLCQAKGMTEIFPPGQYEDYRLVANSETEDNPPKATLAFSHLKPNAGGPAAAYAKLSRRRDFCVGSYALAAFPKL